MSKINNRPLSPHLTIYRPQLTAVLSIYHRITGVFLSILFYCFFMGMQVIDLHLSNYSIYNIAVFINSCSHWFLLGTFFIAILSFFYHLANGIRHLVWDTGRALSVTNVYRTGYIVIVTVLVLTIVTLRHIIH